MSGTLLELKLAAFIRFSRFDRELLTDAISKRVRVIPARRDIICEGERPRAVNVILEGWAFRYKLLADGRRQILSFFVPGDLCDSNVFILRHMDHSLGAVTDVHLAEIPQADFEQILALSPHITKALWWNELVNGSIQREWTTNIGQRTAYERIAHLLCELFIRLRTVGRTDGLTCHFPPTQSELADATGLTQVHVNRTLKELRRDGLIELRNRQLTVLDLARLIEVSMFNPNYLHIDHESAVLDASD